MRPLYVSVCKLKKTHKVWALLHAMGFNEQWRTQDFSMEGVERREGVAGSGCPLPHYPSTLGSGEGAVPLPSPENF